MKTKLRSRPLKFQILIFILFLQSSFLTLSQEPITLGTFPNSINSEESSTNKIVKFNSKISTQSTNINQDLKVRSAVNSLCNDVTVTFTFLPGQSQQFTVPIGVSSVTISAFGASGGDSSFGTQGGLGAKITGDFTVSQGEVLNIIVGGEGESDNFTTAAGGGGSGVVKDGNPLIIAGGGAGAETVDPNYIGKHASITEDGYNGSTGSGFAPPGQGGTGGADGGDYTFSIYGNIARGGRGFNSGAMGSYGEDALINVGVGTSGSWGLGGGGGSVGNSACNCSGGGGGYSGGGAPDINGSGGGGGSFNSGLNQVAIAQANDGDGYVVIAYCEIIDSDNDGISDDIDNCPDTPNPDQANNDGDGLGDVCDSDDDNDGVLDVNDNCPFTANADQLDFDGDLLGDVCDSDDDNDGILDVDDNCQFGFNPDQANYDGDAEGDLCDSDDDNDGCPDAQDPHPFSMQGSTVIIGGCDTGVANQSLGCSTMADILMDCCLNSNSQFSYIRCVNQTLSGWLRARIITRSEQRAISQCASRNYANCSNSNVARSINSSTNSGNAMIDFDVQTWPNPSGNDFNLRVATDNKLDKVDIQVMDITGKRVHFNTFDSALSYRFGESLQAGVYFVRISQGEFNKTLRVIKQ